MGSYNASTGTWTKGADYSLIQTSRNTYRVTGEIPYGDADAIFPTAGNRFAVRIVNKNITSKSQLPSGTIVKTTNTEKASGYNTANKNAFEEDGSLIAIFAPTAETKDAYNREVKIEWEGDGVFVTYTFNLTQATLESAPTPSAQLTPIVPDTMLLSGVVVDPNAKTSAQMDAFLATAQTGSDGFIAEFEDTSDVGKIMITTEGAQNPYLVVQTSDAQAIVYTSEAFTMGTWPVPAGWSKLSAPVVSGDEEDITFDTITAQTTILLDTPTTVRVNAGSEDAFAFLNGTVIGAVTEQ